MATPRTLPTCRPGSTGCRGAASTGWSWRRSASPGSSTGSRSPWRAPSRPRCRPARASHLTAEQVGLTGSAYLIGAVLGSLFFGHLTDRLGRKKLFNVTLGVYLVATAADGASRGTSESFLFFRFLTGAGIGGEYSAINSAIQELIPARLRGRTDLAINGSFWLGAALGALVSVVAARSRRCSGPTCGWRLAFGSGAVLGLVILYLRRFLPESPRWLMIHGRAGEARRGRRARSRRASMPSHGDAAARTRPSCRAAHRTSTTDWRRSRARCSRDYPRPHRARPRADGLAGLLLQRDLLHLCAGADAVLRRRRPTASALHPAVRARQLPRARCCSAGCSTRSAASR